MPLFAAFSDDWREGFRSASYLHACFILKVAAKELEGGDEPTAQLLTTLAVTISRTADEHASRPDPEMN